MRYVHWEGIEDLEGIVLEEGIGVDRRSILG